MRHVALSFMILSIYTLIGCSGAKVDPTSTATEVARIQAEAERLGVQGDAKAALERSRQLSQSAGLQQSGGKSADALLGYQVARAAAVTALAEAVAQRSAEAAETCRRDLADARRGWEDALHQLEQTEKVSGRQARGVDRSVLPDPVGITLPAQPPLPPDSVTVAAIEQAGRAWKTAAEGLDLPTSDQESAWNTALQASAGAKIKPEAAATQRELAAWHVAHLAARVRHEAALRLCRDAQADMSLYTERRDGILWSMVDLERGMKESARAELKRLEERQKSLYDSLKQFEGQFATIRQEARGTIMSLSDILFDFDKATLRREAEINLAKVAVILVQYPEMRVYVEGHTDNIGKEDYNLKLSERRAKTVHDFLVEQGLSASRMETAGFGMSQPVASNADEAGRQKNRRVDLVIRED